MDLLFILLLIGFLADISSAYSEAEVIQFNMTDLKSNTYQKVYTLEFFSRFTIFIHSQSSLLNHTLYCIDQKVPGVVFVYGKKFNELETADGTFVIDDYLIANSQMQTTWECTISNSGRRPIITFDFYVRVNRSANILTVFGNSNIPTKQFNNPTYNDEVYSQKYQPTINSKTPQYSYEEQYAPSEQNESPNQEKEYPPTSIPSSNTLLIIVGVICLLQTLTLVVYIVYKKHCGRKHSIERTSRQETRSAEHVYEDLDYPVTMNIINRPPQPLPPQEREENYKYNTPYDHRILPPNKAMRMTPRTFNRP